MLVLVNKKTKKFAAFNNLESKFTDTDNVLLAKKFNCKTHLSIILKEFRIKSKYEVHEMKITLKKIKI